MKRFGPPSGAPMDTFAVEVSTPVGRPCGRCDEFIVEGDRGYLIWSFIDSVPAEVPWHRVCLGREILGPTWHDPPE